MKVFIGIDPGKDGAMAIIGYRDTPILIPFNESEYANQLRRVAQPFVVSSTVDKFDLAVRLDGGGMSGQAGALRHGIARALVAYDEAYRAVLKSNGMMTRDSRVKERKKAGQPGARKRFQFSKR
jgi:small subunit ribosomal protein S9